MAVSLYEEVSKLVCKNQIVNAGLRSFANALFKLGIASPGLMGRISALPIGRDSFLVGLPNGRKLRLAGDSRSHITRLLYWQGVASYEPYTSKVYCQLSKHARFIVDVGANIGYYSLMAALVNPSAVVIAFEPLPLVFGILEKDIRLNEVTNVAALPLAVGNWKGSVKLYVPASGGIIMPDCASTNKAFVASLAEEIAAESVETLNVNMVTLDDILSSYGRKVDLIKIDTESTEDLVLLGAKAILQRDHPDIICEVLEGRSNVRSLNQQLREHGYTVYKIFSNELVGANEIRERCGSDRPSILAIARALSRELLFSKREPAELEALLRPAIARVVQSE